MDKTDRGAGEGPGAENRMIIYRGLKYQDLFDRMCLL